MKPEAISHHPASDCLNCGAAITGKFCHECGQEATLHVASAREFMHEFVGHYVALEGKLWKSLGLLLFRPGRLTLEYIEGRRARYVQPLRLYLTFSIIFFAMFKIMNGSGVAQIDDPAPSAQVRAEERKVRDAAREVRHAERHARRQDTGAAAPEAKSESTDMNVTAEDARTWLESFSPALAKKVAKFGDLSNEQKSSQLQKAFFSYAPYAVFCLMPVFAFFLKVLYLGSGRRYGEHLLFALHSNGFAFLMMSLLMLVPEFVPFLRPLLVLWLVLYLPSAMRRVYGRTRLATAVRWVVLMLLHMLSITLAISAAFGLAILA